VTFAGNLTSSAAQTWALATGTSALNIASNLLNLDTTNSRIGVGTASPTAALDVVGTIAASGPVRATGTAATAPAFTGSDADTGMYFPASNQVRLSTNGALAIAIDASQNVGVGTASPVAPMHVLGASQTGASIASSNPGILRIGGSVPNVLFVGSISDGAFGMYLQTNGTSPYPIVLQPAGGNVGIGTTSPASRLDVAGTITCDDAGTGLKLPATPGNTDPNTLDAYADGGTANSGGVTWTPTLAFGGASVGITYDTRVGRYTRVGNMIVAHCYIKLTSEGSSVGDATIGGLPTSANLTGLRAGAGIGNVANITFADQIFARIGANETAVTLTETTNAGAETALTDADFTATSEISFTISYPTT
jgi:hypothetical protein